MADHPSMLTDAEIREEIAEYTEAITVATGCRKQLEKELKRRVLASAKYGDWIPDDGYASGHAYARPADQDRWRSDHFHALCGREARVGIDARLYKCGRCESILKKKALAPSKAQGGRA